MPHGGTYSFLDSPGVYYEREREARHGGLEGFGFALDCGLGVRLFIS